LDPQSRILLWCFFGYSRNIEMTIKTISFYSQSQTHFNIFFRFSYKVCIFIRKFLQKLFVGEYLPEIMTKLKNNIWCEFWAQGLLFHGEKKNSSETCNTSLVIISDIIQAAKVFIKFLTKKTILSILKPRADS